MGKIDRKKWKSSREKGYKSIGYAQVTIPLLQYLRKQKVPGGAILVLLAIACHKNRNNEGIAVSLKNLAKYTDADERQVRRWIVNLAKKGIVECQLRTGKKTLYKIKHSLWE